jgi:hypothetical protein
LITAMRFGFALLTVILGVMPVAQAQEGAPGASAENPVEFDGDTAREHLR